MATIVKEVELKLTPSDIVQAIRAFGGQERHELMLEMQRLLFEEDLDVLNFVKAVLPLELEERGRWPESPPPTPEGDREALAAVDDFCGMFPISDLALVRWLAESDELGIFGGN